MPQSRQCLPSLHHPQAQATCFEPILVCTAGGLGLKQKWCFNLSWTLHFAGGMTQGIKVLQYPSRKSLCLGEVPTQGLELVKVQDFEKLWFKNIFLNHTNL